MGGCVGQDEGEEEVWLQLLGVLVVHEFVLGGISFSYAVRVTSCGGLDRVFPLSLPLRGLALWRGYPARARDSDGRRPSDFPHGGRDA